MTYRYLTGLADEFRRWGLDVVELDGWKTRGRPHSFSFDPTHVLFHHTAGPATGLTPSLHVVRDGRPDLSGPLAQVYIGRDRKVYLVAAGRANHAGSSTAPCAGYPTGTDGNAHFVGFEVEYSGPAETWEDDLLEVCYTAFAATLHYLGQPASHTFGHKEWAPSRKIDPYKLNMDDVRSAVAKKLKAGTVAPKKKTPVKVKAAAGGVAVVVAAGGGAAVTTTVSSTPKTTAKPVVHATPKPSASATPKPSPVTALPKTKIVVVKKGQTLTSVTTAAHISLVKLQFLNPKLDLDTVAAKKTLQVGQKLRVK